MTEPESVVPLEIRAAGATHRGKVREHNEDHVLCRDDLSLFLVADGAGGHNAGEVASALAARSMANYFGATIREWHGRPEVDRFGVATGVRRLSAAVQKANHDIVEVSQSSDQHRGMGTTVVALSFSARAGLMHVAHVGDSRCYRLRAGILEALTQDHSLINDVLEQRPELDDKVLDRLPKNVITRALGMEERVRVAVRSLAVVAGDRYLLSTDGLHGMVNATTIAELLSREASPGAVVESLVTAALDAGGIDNIGVVVVDCAGGPDARIPVSARLHSAPARPPESSQPEILILGIEELDLTGAVGFTVVPRGTADTGLADALGKLIGPKKP